MLNLYYPLIHGCSLCSQRICERDRSSMAGAFCYQISASTVLIRSRQNGRLCSQSRCMPMMKTVLSFRKMHEHQPSIDRGYIRVSDIHTLYYEIFGNPVGKPAVFLHGGPGAGCVSRHAGFFDPTYYKVVLLDQRGCGKSTPLGCLEENTTWDLVDDLEKLRRHLRINKWLVMGGSWGVTLALAYGQAYPDAISGFILRGVCMLRQEEIDWFYKQGVNSLFPFAWNELLSVLQPSEHANIIPAFYTRLTSSDPECRMQAARAWLKWEMSLSFLQVSKAVQCWDGKQYSFHSLEEKHDIKIHDATSMKDNSKQKSLDVKTAKVNEIVAPKMTPQIAQARLECHYFLNAGFLKKDQLLKGVPNIRHIPCVIVHGRYDFVCPVKNAFDLHQAWPEAKLSIVMDAGHSMYEKGITQQLLSATDQLRSTLTE
ncbi:hypothetical protein KP509_36G061500 [Ceratopteris richardii]|uniref:Proline iminopeptidase n=1 Tax=Ceratopteris richardii TaxID=49495 RepID=A0A8T2QCG7_CERRI|nr:hypothetical protein KP509_36G061500 [Ceratopteris richardii]